LVNPLMYYTVLVKTDDKYKDKYSGTAASGQTNYDLNSEIFGDAIYETSFSGDDYGGSWGSSHAKYPTSFSPVFVRGGHAFYEGNGAGIFAFSNYTGDADALTGFRSCLVCQ